MSEQSISELVGSVPFWFHSIEVAPGVVTPGHIPLSWLQKELELIQLPDLGAKSVLDVGAWDGFFTFAAETAGARRVVALDHYAWSIDQRVAQNYREECRVLGVQPDPYHARPDIWKPATLPGKLGFDVAHQLISSNAEHVVGDLMTVDLTTLGNFDVVLFLGVLYHLENPIEALRRVRQITGGLAVILTQAIDIPSVPDRAVCEYLPSSELGHDPTNWWAPNDKALHGMCYSAGFSRVETVGTIPLGDWSDTSVSIRRCALAIHALVG